MTVAFNPSRLIDSLELNLYKGVSRSKTDNQQKIEACITETDKLTEQKCNAYRKEAMIMIVCAVSVIALSAIGVAIEWKMESIKSDLNNLSNVNLSNLNPDAATLITRTIETLETTQKNLSKYKSIFNTAGLVPQKGQDIYSCFSKVSYTRLDNESQKKQMRLQQLYQELSNSSTQSLLNDVKEMKRRQQQAKAAAG